MEGDYKVIEMDKYGGKLTVGTRKFRTLSKGEILLKIHCTTIHPADLMFLHGMYGEERPDIFPLIPGFEGSGEIVDVGPGLDRQLINTRVGITGPILKKNSTYNGLWAEYHYTNLHSVMLFDKSIEYEKIAFSFVNPLTAVGFLDTVRKNNGKAVIQDGANGALGKMFIRLCEKEKITSINIVRNKNYIKDLKGIGADHVVSTDESNWEKNLETLARELNAKILFDCIGGNMPGKILAQLPKGSVMYNFGNLEIKNVGIDSASLIFKDKKIQGWWLPNWLKKLSPEELLKWYNYVCNDIKSGSDLFLTKTSKEFALKQINEAIQYYNKNMSEGKVLLRPKF
jgi:NADPH2:quinone reductase